MIFKNNIPVEEFFATEGGILNDHWLALSNNPDKIILKPDVDKYKLLQDTGMLFNIVAYEEEIMVGYAVVLIAPHLH